MQLTKIEKNGIACAVVSVGVRESCEGLVHDAARAVLFPVCLAERIPAGMGHNQEIPRFRDPAGGSASDIFLSGEEFPCGEYSRRHE